ncbi:protein O-mannosyl-transferase 2 [Hyalella azteca]|uniref:Protein O-mannosyl-transferase 2 n=1 Tax=Hyalella azteca TaxID=294128 RepID=A0A8B7PFW8_HYAAZ|nr:protein O-mannosyl-transferase 2 [Hyalella azteca]
MSPEQTEPSFKMETSICQEIAVKTCVGENTARLHLMHSLKKIVEKIADDFRSGSNGAWWCCLIFSTLLTLATRLHYITVPYYVIWDETHFGKMVSMYINRTYFFDVHPPGGKLVLTFFALLSGYNGTFAFEKPGDSYEGYPEIIYMRVLCTLLGTALAPLAFGCAWSMTRRLPAALLAAIFVTAETGTLLLTRFILLDAPLMFFMMAAFLSLCRLQHATLRQGAFSGPWWTSLGATGLFLGCVVSVKFVGLFTVAVVGLHAASQLWNIFADSNWTEIAQHLLARVAALIVLPMLIYFGFFVIHDALLIHSNSPLFFQEASHSPGFQMRLIGNNLHNLSQPADVGYGNFVTLRNTGINGGYLHSHNFTYPFKVMPGKKQQVTVIGIKDHNNWIQILYPVDDPDQEDGSYSGPPEGLQDGDVLRLYHNGTAALIGCGDLPAAVTFKHRIVFSQPVNLSLTESVDPEPEFLWSVHEVKDEDQDEKSSNSTSPSSGSVEPNDDEDETRAFKPSIQALTSRVRLQCQSQRKQCFLTRSLQKLPHNWGYGHGEVTCSTNKFDPYNQWIFEQNVNSKLPNATFNHLQSGLVERFLESHQVMKFRNSRMQEATYHKLTQRPWMWPICYSMHPWFDLVYRIGLIGNPLIFALNFMCLIAAAGLLLFRSYVFKRNPHGASLTEIDELAYWCRWLLVAYLLHYLPFYAMDRVLYYHHYFPALQFSSLLTAVLLGSWFCSFRSPVATLAATTFVIAALACSFVLYCYISYGYPSNGYYHPDNSTYRHLRVFQHWEI